jgi:DNA-binding NtrC family response regulator
MDLNMAITQDVEIHPPFDEIASVREVRQRAFRMAKSDLPLVIEGEPGTGRRTLASVLVHVRETQRSAPSLQVQGTDGIDDRFRRKLEASRGKVVDVMVHHLETFSTMHRRELAQLLHSKRIRLLATCRTRNSDNDAEAGNTSVQTDELEMELSSSRVLLPPIRERGDDVMRWAHFFLSRAATRLSLHLPELTTSAIRALQRHRWPGNLIELDAIINRALCLSFKAEFEATDLGLADSGPEADEIAFKPLTEALEEFRRDYIARALAHFGGNRSATARALGVDVRTIFRYLENQKR